jgi:uncharacterized delta-60 repeat protein
MKSSKKFFKLTLAVWIGVIFLITPTFFNELNKKIEENSNQLHNSITSTDLSYYTWGGIGSESAWDIAMDSLNNSYVVGRTNSFGAGDEDFCLLKFNFTEGLEWNRTFGGIYGESGMSIVLDSLDNIYITGSTQSYGAGGSDIWLLKINSTGSLEWNHTWGGISNEWGNSIALDSQNNAYVAGNTNSFGEGGWDMCLVKFNSTGVVWNYTCGGSDTDFAEGVTMDPLGNAHVVGSTKSFGAGKSDLYLVKFNSSGRVWNYTWGCADNDRGTEIIYSPSGDLYVAGYYEQSPECSIPADQGPIPQRLGLIKFTSEGLYQWNNTWKERNHAYTYAMVMDSSGNAYIAGYTSVPVGEDYDWCLVRFNSSGVADWHCIWGGSETELSTGVVLGPNGTAFVTGYTRSYGAGENDVCLGQFIIGQCPVKLPESINHIFVPGFDMIILIGVAFVVSVLKIKRKQ